MIVQANRGSDVFDDIDEAAGIVWAVDHGARIVNLSIGGAQTSRAEQDAIAYAIAHGVLLVVAAGNTGLGGNVQSYPAALVGSNGLAVASSTATGRRAPFSTAARYVSLAAPGVHVLGATTAAASTGEYPRATFAADPLSAQVAGKLVLYTSQPDRDAQQTVDGFRQKNPGVEVEIFRSGTTEVMNKLMAEIAGQRHAL